MAGELVKWSGGKLVKPSPVEKCRQAREAAVALLGAEQQEIRARAAWQDMAVSSRPYAGLPVDLPRMCAVHGADFGHGNSHGGLYTARYVLGADGRFRLGSMIAVTEALYMRQYAGNGQRFAVPSDDLGQETCPLCGASGHGSVLCHVCKAEVCYGRTSGRYFRCHPGCGGEGVMQPRARVHVGVTPVEMRGGWSVPGGK